MTCYAMGKVLLIILRWLGWITGSKTLDHETWNIDDDDDDDDDTSQLLHLLQQSADNQRSGISIIIDDCTDHGDDEDKPPLLHRCMILKSRTTHHHIQDQSATVSASASASLSPEAAFSSQSSAAAANGPKPSSGVILGDDEYDHKTKKNKDLGECKVLDVVQEKLYKKNKRKRKKKKASMISISITETKEDVPKSIGPYTSCHKILLVGEGDFSFSACLALAFASASNMIATSLDTQEFLLANYGKFSANKKELVTRGCTVLHGIDATKMAIHPHLSVTKFDYVVFNFPHSGFESKDSSQPEMGRHLTLVSRFLRNAKKMIQNDGQIHIRHKSNDPFAKWNIPKLASDQGLCLVEESEFNLNMYPGYHTKYGFGGDKDFHCYPSKTYQFALAVK